MQITPHAEQSTPRPSARPGARALRALAGAVVAAIVLSGCASGQGGGSTDGTIEIQPLFVQGSGGGVGKETITRQSVPDGEFRIDFSEDEVSGLGDASRAASWNAAIVSTLLTGEPLSGRFGFEVQGRIDGPSAGALKTVALIALSRGDSILPEVTMTGTINATGTIGPVGGIPEKLKGAADADIAKVLIPLGQRNSPDSTGTSVDVIREGDRLGVEVIEVGDIYDAYTHLTGVELEPPRRSGDPRLDNRSYDKIDAQVTAALGRFDAARMGLDSLNAETITIMTDSGVVEQGESAKAEAIDLRRQGLIAGAFGKAQEAAALMETVYAVGNLVTPLFTQGLSGLGNILQQATTTGPTEAKFYSFLDSLSTFDPTTIPDVEALVNAYAGAFDAYTMLDFAVDELLAIQARWESGDGSLDDELFTRLVTALMYMKLSEAQITNAQSLFEVGRDNPGAAPQDIDLHAVGDFFRRGADANYAAFTTSGLVKQLADANGLSVEVIVQHIGEYDMNVALAAHQRLVQPAFEAYIGPDKPNAAYASMGYGLSNYVRNQMLVEKYYNNAVLDANYQVTGIAFEGALNNAIDLSREQLAADIVLLREKEASPVITVGSYESAGLRTGNEPDAKFQTLSSYSGGFITTRLLNYLGGWQKG